jgi:hypothetical protein
MASYRSNNSSVENRSLYQMNDNAAFAVQAPSPAHVLAANNNLYKQEATQASHNNQNLRFHLQSHNQQIQTSNFHILSRHYLGQQQQQQQQQHQQHQQHFQYQHHATRQHHMMNMNVSSNIPLNASESDCKLLLLMRRARENARDKTRRDREKSLRSC